MLEVSASPATPLANPEGGAAAVSEWLKAEDGEAGDRNSAASRWPKEETMALLKIRSDMDVAFRDTNPKAPLWDQVSKKLAELGYNRSSKKCKEKFENIYKYHRRTKEGRCGKSNGSKTYRFFEQLEALEGHHSLPTPSVSAPETATTTTTTHVPDNNTNVDVILDAVPCSVSAYVGEHSSSTTSCSGKGFRKRKLTQFLDGLMREVIEKQDMLQRKFVEVLEKCEKDRMAREEAWKKEELALIKKERELLAQERSIAAAKDEVVLAFLRKFTQVEGVVQLLEKIQGQNNGHRDMQQSGNINAAANGGGGGDSDVSDMDKRECGNNLSVRNFVHMSSSRWPKDEVEALIRLRTELDVQSQGNNNSSNGVSKGPLWEDISSAMKGLGYERSAKRCKEKWENINKYFKRMKEKNKRKPQDSKTCPYYHHLEVLYSKKPKRADVKDFGKELKPEELLLHIMESQSQEERQAQQQQVQSHSSSEDGEKDDRDQREGDEEDQNGFQNVMLENSPSRAIMS